MPFGIGGSSSSSSSVSSSRSFDNLDQFGFDLGVDESSSASGTVSGGRSRDSVAFADLFQQLFGGASAAAGGVNTAGLAGAANNLFGAGGDFLNLLEGGGAGGDFLRERVAGGDALADEQIGLLGEDINKFLTESVLPDINQTGIAAGTFGGSRGEVARGIAGEGATDAFARGAAGIRGRERDAQDAIATSLLDQSTQAGQIGLESLSGLFGLAESSAFAGLSPFAALSQILGDPTVLTDSSNESISQALSQAFGFDLGVDSTTGRARSATDSSSSSSSRRFSLGF